MKLLEVLVDILPFVHVVLQIMGNFMLSVKIFMSKFSVHVENVTYVSSKLHVYTIKLFNQDFSMFMFYKFNLNLLLVGRMID